MIADGIQYALMGLYPETGRMHQLRVVCSDILKTPIVGGKEDCKSCSNAKDPKYGVEEEETALSGFLKTKGDFLKFQT